MAENNKNSDNKEEKINTKKAVINKCPSCGANMEFDPDSQMLKCSHCGAKQSLGKTLTAREIDFLSGLSEDDNWESEEAKCFSCPNCGAKVVLEKNQTSKLCPFCGTAHVEIKDELLGLKPNGVIPFKFNSDKASELSKSWAKRKFFAPSKFKKGLKTENINGVYAPCFTFDSNTASVYQGRIGTRHTRVVGSGKNRRTETYIVWRTISGNFYDKFDDVLITAGEKLNQKQIDKISPFDTNNSVKFENKFLLGFMAYHYDKSLSDCFATAKYKMDVLIKRHILGQYNYDVVDYVNISTTHERVTYKYLMLPVYVGNFYYNKKCYNFYVNGETGKVNGKAPVSILKVSFTVLISVLMLALILYLVIFLGNQP